MPTMHQVHVRKDDLTTASTVSVDLPPLGEGAVRLRVESFSVTANNVTYAVVGDGFKYWDFFPPAGEDCEGMGIVPMWGHAEVIESNHADIAVGERVYGYLPMATHLDVVPGKVHPGGFSDRADHRQPMSPVYNQYTRLAADPEHDPAREAERMIYGPLFKTGFIIEYFMRGQDWFGADRVILTSASSKTAMGLASVAKANSPDIKRIGLTSEKNLDFVESTGLYDEVFAYKEIGNLPIADAVTVDFAGNAEILSKLHEHFTERLAYSCLVGATHVDERGDGLGRAKDMPGPKPVLFFAPDHFVAFFKEHGNEKGGAMAAAAWQGFLDAVGDAVAIERLAGVDAARETFIEMVKGKVDPAKGIVVEP